MRQSSINPKPLQQGSRVALAAPARAVSPEETAPAIRMLQAWGWQVVIPDGLYERQGQLAGSDEHRTALMQQLIDDPSIEAIFCCRGGYGTVRIIDKLDFRPLAANPKWIVGYSDVTVLHSHLQSTLGMSTLHATMPINFPQNGVPTPATESLHQVLEGKPWEVRWHAAPHSRLSSTRIQAEVVGGNLSILYSLLGSRSQIDTTGKILLIEDLDEYLYHIDRMMRALGRAGMLDHLAALVVGGLTDMHDNTIPFGLTAEEIVLDNMAGHRCPVLFGAPIGHLGDNNLAIPLGTKCTLETDNSENCRIFAL